MKQNIWIQAVSTLVKPEALLRLSMCNTSYFWMMLRVANFDTIQLLPEVIL